MLRLVPTISLELPSTGASFVARSVAMHPRGDRIFAASADTLMEFSLASRMLTRSTRLPLPPRAIAVHAARGSQVSIVVALLPDSTLCVVDAAAGSVVARHAPAKRSVRSGRTQVACLALGPMIPRSTSQSSGSVAGCVAFHSFSGSRSFHSVGALCGTRGRHWVELQGGRKFGVVTCLAADPSRRGVVAAGSADGDVALWDCATDALRGAFSIAAGASGADAAVAQAVSAMCYSGDGHLLAVGSSTGVVTLWDLANGASSPVRSGAITCGSDPLASIRFLPNDPRRILMCLLKSGSMVPLVARGSGGGGGGEPGGGVELSRTDLLAAMDDVWSTECLASEAARPGSSPQEGARHRPHARNVICAHEGDAVAFQCVPGSAGPFVHVYTPVGSRFPWLPGPVVAPYTLAEDHFVPCDCGDASPPALKYEPSVHFASAAGLSILDIASRTPSILSQLPKLPGGSGGGSALWPCKLLRSSVHGCLAVVLAEDRAGRGIRHHVAIGAERELSARATVEEGVDAAFLSPGDARVAVLSPDGMSLRVTAVADHGDFRAPHDAGGRLGSAAMQCALNSPIASIHSSPLRGGWAMLCDDEAGSCLRLTRNADPSRSVTDFALWDEDCDASVALRLAPRERVATVLWSIASRRSGGGGDDTGAWDGNALLGVVTSHRVCLVSASSAGDGRTVFHLVASRAAPSCAPGSGAVFVGRSLVFEASPGRLAGLAEDGAAHTLSAAPGPRSHARLAVPLPDSIIAVTVRSHDPTGGDDRAGGSGGSGSASARTHLSLATPLLDAAAARALRVAAAAGGGDGPSPGAAAVAMAWIAENYDCQSLPRLTLERVARAGSPALSAALSRGPGLQHVADDRVPPPSSCLHGVLNPYAACAAASSSARGANRLPTHGGPDRDATVIDPAAIADAAERADWSALSRLLVLAAAHGGSEVLASAAAWTEHRNVPSAGAPSAGVGYDALVAAALGGAAALKDLASLSGTPLAAALPPGVIPAAAAMAGRGAASYVPSYSSERSVQAAALSPTTKPWAVASAFSGSMVAVSLGAPGEAGKAGEAGEAATEREIPATGKRGGGRAGASFPLRSQVGPSSVAVDGQGARVGPGGGEDPAAATIAAAAGGGGGGGGGGGDVTANATQDVDPGGPVGRVSVDAHGAYVDEEGFIVRPDSGPAGAPRGGGFGAGAEFDDGFTSSDEDSAPAKPAIQIRIRSKEEEQESSANAAVPVLSLAPPAGLSLGRARGKTIALTRPAPFAASDADDAKKNDSGVHDAGAGEGRTAGAKPRLVDMFLAPPGAGSGATADPESVPSSASPLTRTRSATQAPPRFDPNEPVAPAMVLQQGRESAQEEVARFDMFGSGADPSGFGESSTSLFGQGGDDDPFAASPANGDPGSTADPQRDPRGSSEPSNDDPFGVDAVFGAGDHAGDGALADPFAAGAAGKVEEPAAPSGTGAPESFAAPAPAPAPATASDVSATFEPVAVTRSGGDPFDPFGSETRPSEHAPDLFAVTSSSNSVDADSSNLTATTVPITAAVDADNDATPAPAAAPAASFAGEEAEMAITSVPASSTAADAVAAAPAAAPAAADTTCVTASSSSPSAEQARKGDDPSTIRTNDVSEGEDPRPATPDLFAGGSASGTRDADATRDTSPPSAVEGEEGPGPEEDEDGAEADNASAPVAERAHEPVRAADDATIAAAAATATATAAAATAAVAVTATRSPTAPAPAAKMTPAALMKSALSKLERGTFPSALADADAAMSRLVSSQPTQVRFCARYCLALRLLLSIKAEEKSPSSPPVSEGEVPGDDRIGRAAYLCQSLANVAVGTKHRIVCVRMAVKRNWEARNYGVVAEMLRWLLPRSQAERAAVMRQQLKRCEEEGFRNAYEEKDGTNVDGGGGVLHCATCRSVGLACTDACRAAPVRYCYTSFVDLTHTSEWLHCSLCEATFSPVQTGFVVGGTCASCRLERLEMMQL